MDCWWNAATENQGMYINLVIFHPTTSSTAIDRVHRIGQEKTVYVKHFIVRITWLCLPGNLSTRV